MFPYWSLHSPNSVIILLFFFLFFSFLFFLCPILSIHNIAKFQREKKKLRNQIKTRRKYSKSVPSSTRFFNQEKSLKPRLFWLYHEVWQPWTIQTVLQIFLMLYNLFGQTISRVPDQVGPVGLAHTKIWKTVWLSAKILNTFYQIS
jgi:hypothetical protein